MTILPTGQGAAGAIDWRQALTDMAPMLMGVGVDLMNTGRLGQGAQHGMLKMAEARQGLAEEARQKAALDEMLGGGGRGAAGVLGGSQGAAGGPVGESRGAAGALQLPPQITQAAQALAASGDTRGALELIGKYQVAQATATQSPWDNYKVVGGEVVGPDGSGGFTSVYSAPREAPQRRIIKGADGRNYYEDGEPVLPGVQPTPDRPSAMQEKIQALVDSGMDPQQARGVAAGRFDMGQDAYGRTVVVDKSSGNPIGEPVGGLPFSMAPQEPIPPTEGADYAGAIGGSGVVSNMANTITDMLGLGRIAPESGRAHNALRNLQVRTQTTLQDAVPGRPSNYLLEKLENLTVEPASFWTGEDGAIDNMTQTKALIDSAIRENLALLENPAGLSASALSNARVKLDGLRQLSTDYGAIISQLQGVGSQGGGGDTGGDYSEGEILYNDAGEAVILRNGQWVSHRP